MSFPRYPEYKDSGVEWLGEVPAHWEVKRLRYVVRLNPSKSELRALPSETLVSFIPMEAVGEEGSLSLEQTRVLEDVIEGYTYVREEDVAVAKITPCFENGKAAIMRGLQNGVGLGTTELSVLRSKWPATTPDYLFRVVTSETFRWLGEAHMYGAGGQKRVPDDFMRNFSIAWPTTHEQIDIASFLDHETGKIDALIEEQRRLIELLEEKRQAVISHAVTKGLDPDVPMKDSGVEWLGEVPAHWEVVSLKRIVEFQRGHDLPVDTREEGQIPVVSSGGYTGFHDKWIAKGPGIVTGRYGSIGKFILVEENYWPLNTSLYSTDMHGNNPVYIWYLLHSLANHFILNSLKSAVPGVDRNDIHSVLAALAPVVEQEKIVKYLEGTLGKIDDLTVEAGCNIDLLRERRSALISATVTGKIDVRGWSLGVDHEEPELPMVADQKSGYSSWNGAA